jgi:hypothetical protein
MRPPEPLLGVLAQLLLNRPPGRPAEGTVQSVRSMFQMFRSQTHKNPNPVGGMGIRCGSPNIGKVNMALMLFTRMREILGPNIVRNVGFPNVHDFVWTMSRPFPSRYFPVSISSHHSALYSPDIGRP